MTTPAGPDSSADLAAARTNLAMLQKQAATVSARVKAAKGDAKTRLQARLDRVNTQITSIGARVDALQNAVYEETGQYEKLLSGENRDAFMAIKSLFEGYDLGSLADKIYEYVKNNYSPDTISILLQDTSEYKTRFAGNEARKAAGLGVLSPAEYLSTERAYRQVMQSAGLPIGFYDQSSDFNDWIGKDVSATEVQSRVDMAVQATTLANPTYKLALNQMGINDNDLTAYFLDENKALPYLQKSAATARIGAEALGQGLSFERNYAEQLATRGITREEAAAGYATIAGERTALQGLAGIYGGTWTQRQAEKAVFESSAEETARRRSLISAEAAAFGGATGGGRSGLAQRGGAR